MLHVGLLSSPQHTMMARQPTRNHIKESVTPLMSKAHQPKLGAARADQLERGRGCRGTAADGAAEQAASAPGRHRSLLEWQAAWQPRL